MIQSHDMFHHDFPPVLAGKKLVAGESIAAQETLVGALKTVQDPELSVNVYDLGLIYNLSQAEQGDVQVEMTLTTPFCPVADQLLKSVAEVLAAQKGVGIVTVNLVWDPPWSKEKMSEEARMISGL